MQAAIIAQATKVNIYRDGISFAMAGALFQHWSAKRLNALTICVFQPLCTKACLLEYFVTVFT